MSVDEAQAQLILALSSALGDVLAAPGTDRGG